MYKDLQTLIRQCLGTEQGRKLADLLVRTNPPLFNRDSNEQYYLLGKHHLALFIRECLRDEKAG